MGRVMFQMPTGANDVADVRAMLAAQMAQLKDANLRLLELSKEVVYLNGVVWTLWKDVEGERGR